MSMISKGMISKLFARLRPPPRLTTLRDLTARIGKIEIAYAALDDRKMSPDEIAATIRLRRAAGSLAETCGVLIDDDDDDDDDGYIVDEAELDHARSLLLRRDIAEALIHIERAAPHFLDGLPEAVARHYENSK